MLNSIYSIKFLIKHDFCFRNIPNIFLESKLNQAESDLSSLHITEKYLFNLILN